MKIVNVNNITGVKFNGGNSFRTVLQKDNVGFALMKTVIDKGGPYLWHYKNHQEACYCVSGYGQLQDLTNGNIYKIEPGVTYILDNHEPHKFTAFTEVVLISVFNPPLRGDETHDKNGNYN